MSSGTGGGPGQVDYCAANAFLDAFAHKHSSDFGMTIAIDWGEWLWDAWSDGLQGFPPEVQRYFIEKRRDYGISFAEGMEAMSRILSQRLTHVVVATQDFSRMVEGSKSFSIDAIIGAVTTFRKMQATVYPRPALSTPYAAPETETEEVIAQIWSELLGIDQIGIHDNFFELGGHSLLGSQLIDRLRQSFQIDLPLELIFEAATIAEVAAAIELAIIEEIEQTEMSTVA
jgi:acyl carrier protein